MSGFSLLIKFALVSKKSLTYVRYLADEPLLANSLLIFCASCSERFEISVVFELCEADEPAPLFPTTCSAALIASA